MTAKIGLLCGENCDRDKPCEVFVFIDGDGSQLERGNDVTMYCPQTGTEGKASIESIQVVIEARK